MDGIYSYDSFELDDKKVVQIIDVGSVEWLEQPYFIEIWGWGCFPAETF